VQERSHFYRLFTCLNFNRLAPGYALNPSPA